MNLLCAALLLGAVTGQIGGITWVKVLPTDTDTAIGPRFNSPHFAYVNRAIVVRGGPDHLRDRHQLLLFLTGTGGNADGAQAFCDLAANLGYHVINLMYPDEVPATVCRRDANPNSFEEFRMAIIAGGQAPHITVSRADSIENRFQKLLQYLRSRRPREDWGQFLANDGAVRWNLVAIAGQSQGGGHAALIGIKHRVARVICTGAPKDYSKRLDAPAAWYRDDSATPKACFFTFNHRQDPVGCTPEELLKNLSALGLDSFGAPADAAVERYPYRHTRILSSSFPEVAVTGEESEGAKAAHTAVIANKNAVRWHQVWTYMLTERVP